MNQHILKQDFMAKRSQMRRNILPFSHFNSRWFELTKYLLNYFDGDIENGPKNLKGSIKLPDVIVVEYADMKNRSHVLQIVYKIHDSNEVDVCALYIVCAHSNQQEEWILALRQACSAVGCTFDKKFHKGVWEGKHYTCCLSTKRRSAGCKDATPLDGNKKNHKPNKTVLGSVTNPTKPPKHRPSSPETEDGKPALAKGPEDDRSTQDGYLEMTETSGPESLSRFKWYCADTSKTDADKLLNEDGREGCFIVRDSRQSGAQTLAVLIPASTVMNNRPNTSSVKHYHIKRNDEGKYYLTNKLYHDSIPELVKYHQYNSDGLNCRLRCYPNDMDDLPNIISSNIDVDELQYIKDIGSGQFGKVAKYLYKNREVAVKELKDDFMTEQDFIEEAKAMVSLNHPNLVKMIGICLSKPIKIVTEYMKYGALVHFLKRHKIVLQSNTSRLEDMCLQVCAGMKYLEDTKVIHRDLAARNCLVGEEEVIKICDFGLARRMLDDEYLSSSMFHFAIRWSSPEALKSRKFSNKSDVWSFGILMWEIFTCGQLPYNEIKDHNSVFRVICSERRTPSKPNNCPEKIFNLMQHCWNYEAEKRPSFEILYNIFDGRYYDILKPEECYN